MSKTIGKCRFTGIDVTEETVKYVGATVPGVKARYMMANTPEAHEAKKLADKAFHGSEANCNTCGNLERKPHDKRKDGCLMGLCKKTEKQLIFHPDDPMHMECWEQR
jgi:hypothetical protein